MDDDRARRLLFVAAVLVVGLVGMIGWLLTR
jgi:hypothetical protein